MRVDFHKHNLDKKELENINSVFKSQILSTGKFCNKFEELFSKKFKKNYCSTFSSWTMASYTLLSSLNLKSDDEIIVSPLTWVSSINTIVLAGAKPIFADVDLKTGLMDPENIKKKITRKTKAVIVVHLYGQMCDMKKISKICEKKKIKLIEDCAHCIEGNRDGVLPGQLSYAAIFSFYATKNLTCGEGGAIITNDKTLDKSLRLGRYHGKDNSVNKHMAYNHWDIKKISLKSNMTDISASILLAQIKKIDANWKKRKIIWNKYSIFFKKFNEIKLLEKVRGSKHAMHLFTILVPAKLRDKILKELINKNIGVSVHYRSISNVTFYKKDVKKSEILNSILIGNSTISLPFYPNLTNKEIKYIFKNLNKIFTRYKIK